MNITVEVEKRLNLSAGDKVSFCIRPKDISFVDINKKNRQIDPNEFPVYISQVIANPDSYTVFAKSFSQPESMKDYHFQVEVSRHIYQKLDLGYRKQHVVCLNKNVISLFR